MILIVEVIGAIVILIPFALLQAGRMSSPSAAYLWPNLIGSIVLTSVAWVERQWGFVLVQVVWAIAAAWGLSRRRRDRPTETEPIEPVGPDADR